MQVRLVLCFRNNTRVFGPIPAAKTICSLSPNWVLRTAIGPAILARQLAVRSTGAQHLARRMCAFEYGQYLNSNGVCQQKSWRCQTQVQGLQAHQAGLKHSLELGG